jgi:hypothetical protein
MKKVILLVMFLPYLAKGQIVENYESASIQGWIQSPDSRWKADTLKSISGTYSLHHVFDNPSAGNDCIGFPEEKLHSEEGNVIWRFKLRHGYDPSASNKWCVYLMSDESPSSVDGGAPVNGFAAGVNLTGYDDTLRLWKIKDGTPAVIATCPVNWQNNIGSSDAATLQIERSPQGSWKIKVYDIHLILKGEAGGFDSELFRCFYFILSYTYTSTRDRLLWFDDLEINGVFHDDVQAPQLISCTVSAINSLDLEFDEEVSYGFADPSNFSIEASANLPASITKISARAYKLTFMNKLENKKKATLLIKQVCDNNGNCASDIKAEFVLFRPDPGDVVISEIMADPSPPVLLPEKEYIEISNRTEFTFNLKKWKLSTESQGTLFPGVEIGPHGRMIICQQADTSFFKKYGQTCGIKSFPSLTDEGRMLLISDSLGNLIHGLVYSSAWYGSKLKQTGGWSLEMIDENCPFFTDGNWEASSSPEGGTPGKPNSVARNNPDREFSGIINVFPADSVTLRVTFSETIFCASLHPAIILPGNNVAGPFLPDDPLQRSFIAGAQFKFKKGEVYRLDIDPGLTDFAGNSGRYISFNFGIPESALRNELVFNELLFNSFPEEPDFIEFYNCSGKTFDASQFYIASINPETGDTSELKSLSGESRCIVPGSYYAVTSGKEALLRRYASSDPENIFELPSLPSMPDDRGHLLLLSRTLKVVDEAIYSDKLHNPLLSGHEGISLEKVRPDLNSSLSTSWLSASEEAGWATPGIVNSVFVSSPPENDQVTLSSKRITPDNDGVEDALVLDVNSPDPGNVVTVTVFDESGGLVRKLRENFFAEKKASVVWDGSESDGSLVQSGIYILLVEIYNDKGKMRSWKKVCAVIRK